MGSTLLILDTILLALGLYIFRRYVLDRNRPSLPPGPQGLPLIGNALDMPTSHEWFTLSEWSKRWGTHSDL